MQKFTEGSLEWYRAILNQIINGDMTVYQNQKDCLDLLLNMNIDLPFKDNPDAQQMGIKVSQYAHNIAERQAAITGSGDFDDIYWKYLLLEAPYLLDSYALYIEKNRKPQERFYQPRRRTLKKVVDKLQALEDDKLDELFLHQPARTGKSQIITVGTSWHCARNTEISNLYVTYKEGLGGAFLDGVMEIWTDPTYCHEDVFHSKIARTDAKNHKVDLERKKKYATLSGKGLESGLNGEYDAYGWLILDDILEGIQDVLNPDILRRKQIVFTNNVMSRKKEQCKLILNGTIWSLHDIYMNRLSFLQNNPEAKHIRYDVLKIPALDPETDESNFNYDYGVGYSTQYYRAIRSNFEENDDMAGWLAQYQQEPIERDGALFNSQHMNFYNGQLPDEEPLKVVSACDVALGGSDYLAMPVAYVYEDGSVYIHDVVYDNSEKIYTMPKVVASIINNKVTNAFFEANAGGEGYKDEVGAELQKQGYETNLTSKYAQQMILNNGGHAPKSAARKEQRIWDNAENIRRFYFRDTGYQNAEYRKFMNNVYSFTMTGKNKHDDAPDALSSLAVFLKNGSGTGVVKAVRNPFWGRR
nr:MAG TPA: Terminase [Caudoviricetes sp.]DAT24075.1 MAG TPA: Terminase [Caudoviricetes sp.]